MMSTKLPVKLIVNALLLAVCVHLLLKAKYLNVNVLSYMSILSIEQTMLSHVNVKMELLGMTGLEITLQTSFFLKCLIYFYEYA